MTLESLRTSPILCAVLTLAGTLALGACSKPTDASADNFTAAMNTYLAQRGDLCVGKNKWPIDVTEHEMETGARDAVQMPVLEKLGLVSASVAEIDVKDEDDVLHHMKVRRYALTDAGNKFYLTRDTVRPDGTKAPEGNFCAARLSLDKVLHWTSMPNGKQMVVTYTYKADPAPWMKDPAAQKVFPVVAGVLRGAGHAELTETFRLTDTGWVAVDL
jgi:hypothetical protein